MHAEEFNFKEFDPVLDQERNEVLSNELNTGIWRRSWSRVLQEVTPLLWFIIGLCDIHVFYPQSHHLKHSILCNQMQFLSFI